MIAVIGSINLDLVANVERLPLPGETVPGENFTTAPGGKGANQALAVCRAGVDVRLIGAVGQDSFAKDALSLLATNGVDLSGVREAHISTGVAIIMVRSDGENVIAVIAGGNGALIPGDVRRAALEKGEYLLLQHEIPLPTVRQALETARETGVVSLLNTAPFQKEAAEFLHLADYVIANESEFDLYAAALDLEGASREERMRAFAERTGRTIVVTLAANGVKAARPGELFGAMGLKIDPVDTVGAGDTFCGYLAASLSQDMPLGDALRRAAVAGSLSCLKPGAQAAIPLAAEVDAAMTKS